MTEHELMVSTQTYQSLPKHHKPIESGSPVIWVPNKNNILAAQSTHEGTWVHRVFNSETIK